MMLPQGTLSGEDGNGASFARYAGLLMVLSTIVLVFGLAAMLFWAETCTATLLGTEADKLVIRDLCGPRFTPGGLAAFMTAAGGVLTACTVFLYRENKQAETR